MPFDHSFCPEFSYFIARFMINIEICTRAKKYDNLEFEIIYNYFYLDTTLRILDKCITLHDSSEKDKDAGSFHFEFIDDSICDWLAGSKEEPTPTSNGKQ